MGNWWWLFRKWLFNKVFYLYIWWRDHPDKEHLNNTFQLSLMFFVLGFFLQLQDSDNPNYSFNFFTGILNGIIGFLIPIGFDLIIYFLDKVQDILIPKK